MKLDAEVYVKLGNEISKIADHGASRSAASDCGCGGDVYIEVDIDGASVGSWQVAKDEVETQKRVQRAAVGPAAARTTTTTTSAVSSQITVSRQPVRVGCG